MAGMNQTGVFFIMVELNRLQNQAPPLQQVVDNRGLRMAPWVLGNHKPPKVSFPEFNGDDVGMNISPDVQTFNIMAGALCKKGRVKEAWEVVALMIEMGNWPDVVTYSSLMDGYCLLGHVGKARRVLDTMVAWGYTWEMKLLHPTPRKMTLTSW